MKTAITTIALLSIISHTSHLWAQEKIVVSGKDAQALYTEISKTASPTEYAPKLGSKLDQQFRKTLVKLGEDSTYEVANLETSLTQLSDVTCEGWSEKIGNGKWTERSWNCSSETHKNFKSYQKLLKLLQSNDIDSYYEASHFSSGLIYAVESVKCYHVKMTSHTPFAGAWSSTAPADQNLGFYFCEIKSRSL